MDSFQKSSLPFLFIFSLTILTISCATDTIHLSQSIKDGETLVSSDEIFQLGFFSPANSENRYLGIWYRNITVRTYVWVANRKVPLRGKSGVLRVTHPGILALFNDTNGVIIWSSNSSTSVPNPAAKLLDSGNLILKDAADSDLEQNFIWQSFDYPSDTFLPGMSIGWNYATGMESYLSSWRSTDDPYPGEYTAHLDPTGYPQMFNKRGGSILYRIGPWDGLRMSGASHINRNDGVYKLTVVMNKNEVKYREDTLQKSVLTRIILNPNGVSSRMTWNFRTQAWIVYSNVPMDSCDTFNTCGGYGSCVVGNSPPCVCLDRFVPEDPESWGSTDWSRGCVRRTALKCEGDVFLKYSGIKLPDARNSTFNDKMVTLPECEAECLSNCDCMGYRQLNMSGAGSGCLFYHGDLIDIRDLPQSTQDLYIRMASSESAENVARSRGKKGVTLIASFTTAAGLVLVCVIVATFCVRKRKKLNRRRQGQFRGSNSKEAELPFFHFSTILKATEQFSDYNKLGEGGFGPVYRGVLEDGQEIAVKRLSKTSSQGIDELKNEVILIAKLQHRNLVRLLGCCIERDENMLIYEFMPNSSLDLILFDQTKSMFLDWRKRFHIISGIAKGLLYLHQDSRLRIIHRDLKASNILLDADLNPKISDFGLARSFVGNEIAAKTRRVVGTYGYMSPEYAIDGLFSIKSDVFSFGVLVLEVVSGKRNRGFSIEDHNLNLLGHAWMLYKEDNLCKLVDASLGDPFNLSEVMRAIQVGLLCVQNCPEDRPSMSSVVFMLGNEAALPQVKPPGFFSERDVSNLQSFNSSETANSENQITITMPSGR